MTKPTILIIDDVPEMLETLQPILRREFHVLTAPNGKSGLLSLETNLSISLILLDLDMPVMNGLEMLKRLRKKDNDIKVLIMSGKCSYEWAKECANLHVHGYLEKPFVPNELISIIKKHSALRSLRS